MKSIFKTLVAFFAVIFAVHAQAVTVQDEKGEFTLNTVPKRIVALEYSYVDALAQVGVSPVGVADDNQVDRILPQVRAKISPWTSVGTRAQPSLEAIAALKPDLIIADNGRHSAVYAELQKIAPTVMFNSYTEGYDENLATAQKIGDLVGKGAEMKARIADHNQKIAAIAKTLPQNVKVVFGVSRPLEFHLFNNESYAGGLLQALGFTVPQASAPNQPKSVIGLEQLVAEKPDWMFIGNFKDQGESIVKKWVQEPLWALIPAVKNNQFDYVDNDLWSRARGMTASEIMAQNIQSIVTTHQKK